MCGGKRFVSRASARVRTENHCSCSAHEEGYRKDDHPADFRVRINLGNCLVAEGRFAEALACFDKALRLNPGSARAHYNRGIVLRRLDLGSVATIGRYR